MHSLAFLIEEHRRLKAAFPFSDLPFEEAALAVFRFQAQANPVLAEWLRLLKRPWQEVDSIDAIPFLPIEFYKSRLVTSLPQAEPVRFFYSSRTTGQVPSRHPVYDPGFYEKTARRAFEQLFGSLHQYRFLSLLPSYSQTGESSLVYMVHDFALAAGQGGAVKIEPIMEALEREVEIALCQNRKPVLFGVTHALLALTDTGSTEAPFLLFETGGMKGRGAELTRSELHARLRQALPGADIRSEYGMTELFSQGYTLRNGGEHFAFPPWMAARLRDLTDPLSPSSNRFRGGLNIIDLANLDTCAFIATADQAERTEEGLAILGRIDHAEVRGCNLLAL